MFFISKCFVSAFCKCVLCECFYVSVFTIECFYRWVFYVFFYTFFMCFYVCFISECFYKWVLYKWVIYVFVSVFFMCFISKCLYVCKSFASERFLCNCELSSATDFLSLLLYSLSLSPWFIAVFTIYVYVVSSYHFSLSLFVSLSLSPFLLFPLFFSFCFSTYLFIFIKYYSLIDDVIYLFFIYSYIHLFIYLFSVRSDEGECVFIFCTLMHSFIRMFM